jgi:hypothetical protein
VTHQEVEPEYAIDILSIWILDSRRFIFTVSLLNKVDSEAMREDIVKGQGQVSTHKCRLLILIFLYYAPL